MITSWPGSNPASTLEPGDVFTLSGVYRRRRDFVSSVLAWFGYVRYTNELQPLRVRSKYSSYVEYEPTDTRCGDGGKLGGA